VVVKRSLFRNVSCKTRISVYCSC